jgi:hypothetical protein
MTHRNYFYAEDKEGNVCALVVLAQLAPRYGVQVKWALNFLNAPNGAIEYATLAPLSSAAEYGHEAVVKLLLEKWGGQLS